jgi:hypothetical protein
MAQPYATSLRSLATQKATLLLALILITSPLAGFRPIRAARFRTRRRYDLPGSTCLVEGGTGQCVAAAADASRNRRQPRPEHQLVAEHVDRVGLPRPGVTGEPPFAALPVLSRPF